jgi:phage baseplate assembly protein W
MDAGLESTSFLGQGIAFPMRVDHTGSIALSTGAQDIDGSIIMVLSTAKGERLMRPQFGCTIWDQLFDPVNANTLGRMAQGVRDALSQWEPRIEVEEVEVTADPERQERVLIGITYRVKTTNDRRNLVYPFYVIPREGEE